MARRERCDKTRWNISASHVASIPIDGDDDAGGRRSGSICPRAAYPTFFRNSFRMMSFEGHTMRKLCVAPAARDIPFSPLEGN